MCEPATIMLAATAASTALGSIGKLASGNATNAAAQHSAKTNQINAQTQEYQARDAILRGNAEEKKQRAEASMYAGSQRAAQAANGIDVTYGSALDLAVDTAQSAEIDALTIRSNSYREAYGFRVGAQNSRDAAAADIASGKAAKTAGQIGAASTLISGAANAYGSYKKSTATI